MVSRVDDILRMDLFGEDEDGAEWVEYGQDQIESEPVLPTPYKRYSGVVATTQEEKEKEKEAGRPPRKGRDKSDLRRTAGSTQSSAYIEDSEYDTKSSLRSTMKSSFTATGGSLNDTGFLSENGNTSLQSQATRPRKNDSIDSLSSQHIYDSYSKAIRK